MKLFHSDFAQASHRIINTSIQLISNLLIIYFFYRNGEGQGLIDFSICFIVIQYLFLISEWGINLFALDKIRDLDFLKKRYYFVNNLLIAKCFLGLFCSLIFLILNTLGVFGLSNPNFIYSALFLIFCGSLNPLWLYQSIEKIQDINKHLLAAKIFQVLLLIFFTSIENLYYFFISQGIVFIFLFLVSLRFLNIKIGYLFEVKKRNIYAAFCLIKRMFKYFLSNLYNNINLTFWGLGLIYLGNGLEIILFNLVEIFSRSINVLTQSLFEPIFRKIRISLAYSAKFLTLILIFLALIYIFIDPAVRLFFPSFYHELIDIFKVFFFVIIFVMFNKFISFFFLGKLKISLMNNFNAFFLFLHFLFFVIWFFFTNNSTIEIVQYLLFFNLACFSILIIFIMYSKNNYRSILGT